MGDNRWVMNRAGLLNFWYYDEEEFDFSDGRLLLRGSNGSGKSVTMQSFIPLLLDGNKSPERLDPFGSRARKIENYLLGEEDSGKDESLGYLFMEFKKRETENYLTIGMGFKAVRGKPIKSWGFVITDGRRVAKDFLLYKNVGEKLPLTMKELENRIGSGGQVAENQGDYMRLVNNHLFGFSDIEEYDELVKLLIQLRTPKLSKDVRPTTVYEIMENSLQQLSEDDLRPMSEAIENMDNIKSKLEELKESKKAGDKIRGAFDKYNNYIILDKAKLYLEHRAENERLEKDKLLCSEERDKANSEYISAEEALKSLNIQKVTVEEKKRELDKHDSLQIREKIEILKISIQNLNQERASKHEFHEKKKSSEIQISRELKGLEDKKLVEENKLEKTLETMDEAAEEFSFDEQSFLRGEIRKASEKEYNFNFVKVKLSDFSNSLEKAVKALEEEQRKNEEYDKALLELDRSKLERVIKEKRLEEAKLLLLEIKEEYIEKIYGWRNHNLELKLTEDGLIKVSRAVNNFNYNATVDSILEEIRKEYNLFEGELNGLNYKLKNIREGWEHKAKDKKIEIQEWKNKKDPEPIREGKVIKNRAKLAKLGIPYMSLYRAIDFNEGISEEIKGKLEEALLDMGLLDALIIPDKYKNEVLALDPGDADKYLFSSPKFLMHDLSELMKVDRIEVPGISNETVENVLKSILLDENKDNTYINEKGEYSIGIIRGRVTNSYTPKFIGSTARIRYREETINRLVLELKEIEAEILKAEEEITKINSRLSLLKKEFHQLPAYVDLLAAVNELREAQFNYDRLNEEVLVRVEAERTIYEQLKKVRDKVYELTYKLPIKANLVVYEEALKSARNYKEYLFELEKIHGVIVQTVEKMFMLHDQRAALLEDMDNILYDLSIADRKLKEAAINLRNSEEQLKLTDYETIKVEIEDCIRLLGEIPKKVIEESRRSEREKSNYHRQRILIAEYEDKLRLSLQLVTLYEEALRSEYNLGYVLHNEEKEESLKLAKRICKEIIIDEKNIKEKEDYVNTLFQRFQENNQYLREYTVKTEYVFEAEARAEVNEYDEIRRAYLRRKRLNIIGLVRGKEVSFYKLIDFISEGIEENENLLRDSDRQLFEDILVKNISKKIRAKIFHSEQWVRKMNELMEGMNTSSGLSFSLKWRSKKAETEEQLDTKELVELLKQDGNLLREADLNKLSEHFRSKIESARRDLEDKGQNQTFHSIMREILDYRKWFEFKLYYLKTGQNKKELTNNAFYQFSGGEKAMAMYVPLFSAVYARYEGAKPDSPRIISLDEAFAGVDEKNIRDMFRLLNELGLNFIINSQILWGDYDTVPSLSISELIRPDNADYVTVIRYTWNGRVKELVV